MKIQIGFEIHEQINTATKLYCDSPTNYRDVPPNTNVCEVCTGMPGAKPMPVNNEAIDAVVEIALMLGCEVIADPVYIQRKHYDYPDLPSGYQRTSLPIAKDGKLDGVGIWEVHLEEDPGKYDPITGKVDYNRSGVPLVEVVTAPDVTSPEQARGLLRELTKVLQYTGRVRTEGGTMRMDCNISLEGGARVEIKNINSVRGAYKALKFEVTRQRSLLKRGVKVKRETRAFLEAQMITRKMRVKEEAEDYRYIPDPDIPPLVITPERIAAIRASMPEPPHLKLKRFIKKYGITHDDAWAITSEIEMADAFEEVCEEFDPKKAADVFRHEIKRVLTYGGMGFKESGLTSEKIVELLNMAARGEITQRSEKKVLERMIGSQRSPHEIVEELGLLKLKGEDAIARAVDEVLKENEEAVHDYEFGVKEAFNYIVGEVMKKTKGRADPQAVQRMLKKKLG